MQCGVKRLKAKDRITELTVERINIVDEDESDGQRVYGLGFHERPDEFDIDAAIAVHDMADGPDKEERLRQLLAEGVFGVQRMFVGCNVEGEPVVSLHDSKGRQRLRLKVDADDASRIETLDEHGHVVSSSTSIGGAGDAQEPDESIHEQLADLRRQMGELERRLEQLGGDPVT